MNRVAQDQGIDSVFQILTCDWIGVFWATGIILSAIDQFSIFIIKEEIRGACRTVGFGDFLGFIEQVGKGVGIVSGILTHFFGTVIGIGFDVVLTDGHDSQSFRFIFICKMNKRFADMNHIGAVIAKERDQ